MNKKEYQIQRALYIEFFKGSILIPNTHFFEGEADLLQIKKKSGLVIEFEIKTSLRDFKRDFKKPKHWYFVNRFVEPVANWYSCNGQRKHHRIAKSADEAKSWTLPNKFVYVVPAGLLKPEDVPDYAGLYEVRGLSIEVLKKPPFLHKEKIGKRSMLRLLSILGHRHGRERFNYG